MQNLLSKLEISPLDLCSKWGLYLQALSFDLAVLKPFSIIQTQCTVWKQDVNKEQAAEEFDIQSLLFWLYISIFRNV